MACRRCVLFTLPATELTPAHLLRPWVALDSFRSPEHSTCHILSRDLLRWLTLCSSSFGSSEQTSTASTCRLTELSKGKSMPLDTMDAGPTAGEAVRGGLCARGLACFVRNPLCERAFFGTFARASLGMLGLVRKLTRVVLG